jgi:acyl-CoA synthetase (NDP forming)
VVLVGASERNLFSNVAMRTLGDLEFDGRIHLVNRRGGEVYGRSAATSCRSLGEPVDAAYMTVPFEGLLDSVRDAIEAGIRNIVIVTGGFAEVGGEGAKRQAELAALCEAEDVRVLGPNCLGFRNVLDRVALGTLVHNDQSMMPASIALVSVSGSSASAIAHYGVQQGAGFTHVIAFGNEMNVTAADLIDYMVDIPEVKAIALFLETVKDPSAFAAAAGRALAARRPIVAIKAGAAPATAALAQAHTNALVGDDKVFDAACERLGVVRVSTFEELVNTAAVIAAIGPLKRPGVGFVSISGGVCEVASDLGPEMGVSFPAFAPETRAELRTVISDLGQTHNPLDITGVAVREESLWVDTSAILSRDPAIGLNVINWEIPLAEEGIRTGASALIGEAHQSWAAPTLMVTSWERPIPPHALSYLQRTGLQFAAPGVRNGLQAIGKLAWWSERVLAPPEPPRAAGPSAVAERPRGERETLDLLARFGVPVVPTVVARSAGDAVRAATEMGGPVALKVLSPDIAHKTEAGGVKLGLEGADAIEAAYAEILRSVAAKAPEAKIEGVLVAPMRTGGLEMLAGVARDPDWGLVMALGLGGIWVEALKDTALVLLPADASRIARGLRSLKAAKLFEGYRGAPPVNVDALAEACARIGDAAMALGPDLAALEVNPLFVRGEKVEALDALAVWAS